MSVTIDDTEVIQNLEALPDRLRDDCERLMRLACLKVEADAKEKCPVGDSGMLRSSIVSEVEAQPSRVDGYIGSNLEYAPYVHEGTGLYAKSGNGRKDVPWRYRDASGKWHTTKGQHPQPFLQGAVDEDRAEILDAFREVLQA